MCGGVGPDPGSGWNAGNAPKPRTWAYSLIVEWHVLLVYDQSANSLLPVPTGKFISQLGPSRLPYEHLY